MKYFLIAMLAITAMFSCLGENYILNPGFEELSAGKLPVNWGIGIGTGREIIKEKRFQCIEALHESQPCKNKISVSQTIPHPALRSL